VSEARLVAVLGYSSGRANGLHPVCAARLARGAEAANPNDAVLLSGWARGRRPHSEAALMAEAWGGQAGRVLLDRRARSTYGNVVAVAAAASALSVREVVLVTSGWHGRRAAALLHALLRGSGRRVTLAMTSDQGTRAARLRELACWALVPIQTAAALCRR